MLVRIDNRERLHRTAQRYAIVAACTPFIDKGLKSAFLIAGKCRGIPFQVAVKT